ncbi:MAG: hypothetical protein AAF430_23290 [Myxococcota bacterium]
MKRTITVLASLALAALLLPALGCGSGDSTPAPEAPSSPAPQASTPAPPEPPPAMPEKEEMEEMAGEMTPLEECHKLADAEQWLDAVGPCKAAAEDHPDDLKIKHALQQAAAAATSLVEGS